MKPRAQSRVGKAPTRERVVAAIEALPELDRLVLSLQLLEGLTPLEAAGALRVPTHEVHKRTATARWFLSRELGVRSALRRVA